jgi:hypothetical protein
MSTDACEKLQAAKKVSSEEETGHHHEQDEWAVRLAPSVEQTIVLFKERYTILSQSLDNVERVTVPAVLELCTLAGVEDPRTVAAGTSAYKRRA